MGELQMYQGYVHGAQRWGKPFLLSGVTLGDPEKPGEKWGAKLQRHRTREAFPHTDLSHPHPITS